MAGVARVTESETEILAVVWRLGQATVRDVHEALQPERNTGYTTTLKFMQLMLEKGLLIRDDDKRPHVYRAAKEAASTQAEIVGRLINKVFDGSASALVQRALDTSTVKKSELEDIKAMIDAYCERQSEEDGK